MTRRSAVWAVVAAAALFGTTGTAQELGPDAATPLGVGTWRIAIGSVVLWLFARRPPRLVALRRHHRVIAVGALGVAVYQPGFFVGTERSGVALGTIVALASGPVFAGLLQWMWFGRRPTRWWAIVTIVMVVGGVVVVAGRGGAATFSPLGIAASLSAGFGYALYAIATKTLIERGVHSTEALAWQFSVGAAALSPLLVIEPSGWLTEPSGALMAAHLGILTVGVAYVLYGWGLRSLSTSTAVTLTLAEPLTAALAAVVVLGERLAWFGWIGVATIIVGLVLAGREPVVDDRSARIVAGPPRSPAA
ncbi:MAG: EamA family transporter [Actinomycetota bacterium]